MTQRLNHLSRRNMFTLTAGGASALALGGVVGGTAHAAAPTNAKFKPISEAKLPAGSLVVPGDLKLDPDTLALAEKLLARSKHAVLIAATRPNEAPADDKVVAAARQIVGELRAKRVTKLQSNLKKASTLKDIGELTKAAPALAHASYNFEMKRVIDTSQFKAKKKEEPAAPQFQPPLAQKLEFFLNSVKCVQGTSGESGSDEILLGGQIVTPGGVVKKIDRFKVGNDFDPGEVRWYDYSRCGDIPRSQLPDIVLDGQCPNGGPDDRYLGRRLGATNLGVDLPWPATVGIVLVMGEEDPGGGFGQFLEKLYGALEDEVKEQLDKLGQAAGAAIGGALGEAIGKAIAYALGELIDWLVNLFDNPDDPISAKSWSIQLPSPEMAAIRALSNEPLSSPPGTWAAPMKKLKFNGDGGKYEVRLHWRVRT